MTRGAIEFNDQSLLIQADDETRYAEPGFARLTDSGVQTGEEARAVAWREPQHMYNQYWCHLNETPLANRHRHARHHADIAFAQLRKLWQQGGEPDSLVLLVPGSFTRTQLSLLLGMVKALPAQTDLIMDSALAACLDIEDDTLFVDLHLHEAVLTVCRRAGGAVRVVDQEVFPGAGMSQIHNSVARHISDFLIDSYRFDPLHSSETEQSIFDEIPHWLTTLRWEPDITIKLESDKGELPCILRQERIKGLIEERMTSVGPFLEEWQGCEILLAHRSGLLAGMVDAFGDARVARRSAATRRALARFDAISAGVDDLYRLREVSLAEAAEASNGVNGEPLATHLLWEELALPLSKPLSVRLTENGPEMHNRLDKDAALTVVLRNRSLETLHGAADTALPQDCRPGASIRVGGHELKLIRVQTD